MQQKVDGNRHPGGFDTRRERFLAQGSAMQGQDGTRLAQALPFEGSRLGDGDPRPAYAIYDLMQNVVELRRVDYDIQATQRKILEAGLPARAASRLEIGR